MRPKTTFVAILLCIAFCSAMFGQQPTVTVAGSKASDIQSALNVLSLLSSPLTTGKLVIPAGTYSVGSSSISPTSSPSNLWIHCESGAVLQASQALSSGMILLQDISSVAMGNVRVDGCVFDSNSFDAPGVVAVANNIANKGLIEIDHNEFKNSTTQGVLLQTCIAASSICIGTITTPSNTQLINNGFIHDNICHDFISGQSNAACFESKTSRGNVFRQNYMYNFNTPSGTNCANNTPCPPSSAFSATEIMDVRWRRTCVSTF